MRLLFLTAALALAACATESTAVAKKPPAPGCTEAGGTAARVNEAGLKVTLCQSEVMAVIASHVPELKACAVEQHAQQPGSTGKLLLRWRVLGTGATTAIEVLTEDLLSIPLSTCLVAAVKTWQFPAHATEMPEPVVFPFKF